MQRANPVKYTSIFLPEENLNVWDIQTFCQWRYLSKYVKPNITHSVIVAMSLIHKGRPHFCYTSLDRRYIFFPHLPWSHLSFSALPPEQKSPLSTPQLPPSLPPAFAQPVGYFHARPIEFKGSLGPISVRGWDQTTRSCCHAHLKASVFKWTLNNGTHSMEELRSSRETDKHSLRGKWRKGLMGWIGFWKRGHANGE